MSETRNLYQRILSVMEYMGAVGKGGKTTYGDRYEYHRIDDVDDKLRHALVANGVVLTITHIDAKPLEHIDGTDKHGNPRTTWYAECVLTLELVNVDDPADRTTIQGWGQGLDYSDKATGKAISYAAKAAYLSAFHLRGQPDNEADDISRRARQPHAPPPKPKPAPKLTPEEAQFLNTTIKAFSDAPTVGALEQAGAELRDLLASEDFSGVSAAAKDALRNAYNTRLAQLQGDGAK